MAATAKVAGYWRKPPSHRSIGATVVPVIGHKRVLVGGFAEQSTMALLDTLRTLGIAANTAVGEEEILNALERPIWDLVLLFDDEHGSGTRTAKIYAFMIAAGTVPGGTPIVVLACDSDTHAFGPSWIIEVLARHDDKGTEIVRALLSDIAQSAEQQSIHPAPLRASLGTR